MNPIEQAPIALTGVTGFVGRRVLAVCGEAGVAVRALARRPAALEGEPKADLEVIQGDLLDEAALARLAQGASAIIHCAGAIAGVPETLTAANVEGTRRLAAAARQAGTARFVHVSSLAAREPGLSGYALTKRLGEREVIDGLPRDRWVILRPPVIYGRSRDIAAHRAVHESHRLAARIAPPALFAALCR